LALRREVSKINADIINVHYASGYGTLAMLACIKPYILSVWGSDVYEFPYQSTFKMWLIQKSLRNATHIASTSHAMASQVRKVLNDDECEVTVTPFGIDINCFKAEREAFDNKLSITIGIVKRLEYKYGIDLLLEAFKQVKDYVNQCPEHKYDIRLNIVGDGSLEQSLKKQALRLGIGSDVSFVGAIENSEVNQAINDMDIFVVPSRIESFGVSAIEAMACQRPCIVADTGGLPEVVSYGKVGLIADYESADSIAKKIIYMVEHQGEAIALGKEARNSMLANYTNEAALTTMKRLYQRFYEYITK